MSVSEADKPAGTAKPTRRMPDLRRPTQGKSIASGAGHGKKFLLLLLFVIVLNLLQMIATLLAVAQFLFAWLGGGANPRLSGFGAALASYTRQVVRFLAYASERPPFPFAAWPAPGDDR